MELIVSAEVYHTESGTKVKQAIESIFLELEIEREEGEVTIIRGRSTTKQSLERFYTLLRSQGILDAVRRAFMSRCSDKSVSFELNKQAAFMGLINFSEATFERSAKQPQLGWIRVEINDEDIRTLIEWLAPSTRKEEQP